MGLFGGGSSPDFNFTPEDILSLGQKGTTVGLESQKRVAGQEGELFPELTSARNIFSSRLSQPLNEAGISDLMSQFSANAGLRSPGGMSSPASILQNVFGVEDRKRNIQNEAIGGLQNLFAPLRISPIQPSQGLSGALQQDQLKFATAQQRYQAAQAQAAQDAQGKGALVGLGLAAAAPFAAPLLTGGGAGAALSAGGGGGFPSLTSFLNPSKSGTPQGTFSSGSFQGMTPAETAALRLSLAQGGMDLGRSLTPLF